MTSRERIEAAFNHKSPDRTPIFEYVLLSPVAQTVLERPYEDYGGNYKGWECYAREVGFEKALRQYAKDRVELAQKLGHDMLYVVPNPVFSQAAESPQPTAAPIDDPVEELALRNQRALEQPQTVNEDCFLVYQYLHEEMEKAELDLPIKAPAYNHGVWDDVALMQTMLLDPKTAHTHFALATKQAVALIQGYLSHGIKMIGIGGDFAGKRPLISPECYKTFILPHLKTLSNLIHQGNAYAINASDGDLWSVLEDFLINSGVDGYIEIDKNAGMDLRRLKQEYGEKITFLGNIDCGNLLSFGTADEIKNATMTCIEDGLGGGHIFTASNAIMSSIPFENYLIMVNTYRSYFGLPLYH